MSEHSDEPIVLPAPLPEEPQKSGGRESRGQVRFPFTAAAEIYELHSQTRLTGRCSDLSSGGCYIDTLSPFAVGTTVRVRLERDLHEFEAAAVVAYAHVSMGMGLTFTEMKRGSRNIALLDRRIERRKALRTCPVHPGGRNRSGRRGCEHAVGLE